MDADMSWRNLMSKQKTTTDHRTFFLTYAIFPRTNKRNYPSGVAGTPFTFLVDGLFNMDEFDVSTDEQWL